jgi:NADPH:quinone reductase-like Zn-dependent oxidoreductase
VAAWSLLTQGSYAEYYKVPAGWTVEIPADVSFVQARVIQGRRGHSAVSASLHSRLYG